MDMRGQDGKPEKVLKEKSVAREMGSLGLHSRQQHAPYTSVFLLRYVIWWQRQP